MSKIDEALVSSERVLVPQDLGGERDAYDDLKVCAEATGGKWTAGSPADAVVTDAEVEGQDADMRRYYGGSVVCESANTKDRQFIALSHEALPYWIRRCLLAEALLREISEDAPHA